MKGAVRFLPLPESTWGAVSGRLTAEKEQVQRIPVKVWRIPKRGLEKNQRKLFVARLVSLIRNVARLTQKFRSLSLTLFLTRYRSLSLSLPCLNCMALLKTRTQHTFRYGNSYKNTERHKS